MQTEDIEQKKLVYLYLMNYAKTQPELVILAVNTFVKVSRQFILPIRVFIIITSRIRTTLILSFVPFLFGQWVVFELRRLSITFPHLFRKHYKTSTPMFEKLQLFVSIFIVFYLIS